MTVFYAFRGIRYWLISGVGYLILGVSYMFIGQQHTLEWIWVVLSLVHLFIYFYQKSKGYLSIKDGMIKKHDLSFQKIAIGDIRSIRYFAGDYILKGNGKQMTIAKDLLNDKARNFLDMIMRKENHSQNRTL